MDDGAAFPPVVFMFLFIVVAMDHHSTLTPESKEAPVEYNVEHHRVDSVHVMPTPTEDVVPWVVLSNERYENTDFGQGAFNCINMKDEAVETIQENRDRITHVRFIKGNADTGIDTCLPVLRIAEAYCPDGCGRVILAINLETIEETMK